MTMVFVGGISIVNGVYKPTNITEGHHLELTSSFMFSRYHFFLVGVQPLKIHMEATQLAVSSGHIVLIYLPSSILGLQPTHGKRERGSGSQGLLTCSSVTAYLLGKSEASAFVFLCTYGP